VRVWFPAFVLALAVGSGLSGAAVAAVPVLTPRALTGSAGVALSTTRAGARPVAVRLTLSYDMQCGYPGRGPLVVALPRGERVPAALGPAQVLVDGRRPASLGLSGDVLTVGLQPPPRVMCDVIGPGRLVLELERSAGLGNPGRAGLYTIRASVGQGTFTASFTLVPA
jgi:hypothetical protein